MWLNVLGWTATAVFSISYFVKRSGTLRGIQAGAAVLWIVYGFFIHSAPVIFANLIVGAAAGFSALQEVLAEDSVRNSRVVISEEVQN